MRKIYSLFVLILVCVSAMAQYAPQKVQGRPHESIATAINPKKVAGEDFTFNDIKCWFGEGANKTALVVQWNSEGETNALVWGYRWDGEATGADLIKEIAKEDPRFYFIYNIHSTYGMAIGGLGFDTNNSGDISLIWGEKTGELTEGAFNVTDGGFDDWKPKDATDYWQGGWYSGFWSYWTKESGDEFSFSQVGATSRQLVNGCWDYWNFSVNMETQEAKAFKAVEPLTEESNNSFSFDDIQYWVGKGANQAALTLQWNQNGEEKATVWGYRWDGEATSLKMLQDIAAADSRLYFMFSNTQYGAFISGIGYDKDYDDNIAVYKNIEGKTAQKGAIEVEYEDYANWINGDSDDYWKKGTSTGFWNLAIKDGDGEFTTATVGASTRVLQNGSWDFYNYSADYNNPTPSALAMQTATPNEEGRYTNGIFFLNQDWFGHRNSSINYVSNDEKITYEVYRKANPGEGLGATAAYATIYGDRLYITCKQNNDGGDSETQGSGRFIVANAKTMKKVKGFADLKGRDGRSFVAVNNELGYIGTSNGILTFDMENLEIGNAIPETDGSIGTMYHIGKYVFATNSHKGGVLVINTEDNTVKETIQANAGEVGNIVVSKDGNVWIAATTKLVKINPFTLETTSYDIPDEAKLPSSNFAWTPDQFFASQQTNTLYWGRSGGWTGSKTFFKFEIDNENPQPVKFFDLTGSGWYLYAAAAGINPVTDHIFLHLYKSFAKPDYTIYEIDTDGNKLGEYELTQKNWWFPEMPFYTDNISPKLGHIDALSLTAGNESKINLNNLVTDLDNFNALITKELISISDESILSASIDANELVLNPLSEGTTDIIVRFNSNGKTINATFNATIVEGGSGIKSLATLRSAYYTNEMLVVNGCNGYNCQLFTMNGKTVKGFEVTDDEFTTPLSIPAGIYILSGSNGTDRVNMKIIIK